jgi:indolepyruvate ferredoxin oxidoreductase alpha subunit
MTPVRVIDALADGLTDGGCQAFYNFPGFHSHNLFEKLGGKQISLNERAAYAEAFGSSLAGKRTAVTFKNVGLNIASDAYLHSIISGVNAGMVIVVFDDIDVNGSQESQDSRHYFNICGGLWLEPSTIQEAYDIAYDSFYSSEFLDIPVVIRVSNIILGLSQPYSRKPPTISKFTNVLDASTNSKYVVNPYYFNEQSERLIKKERAIQAYVDVMYKPKYIKAESSSDAADVMFGCVKTDKDNCNKKDVLSVVSLPIPTKLYAYIKKYEVVEISEYGTSVVHDIIAKHFSPNITSSIIRPHPNQQQFSEWSRYRYIFESIAKTKPDFVIGDVTQFTVETTKTINACLSLGVAVSTSIGYAESSDKAVIYAISGDCSFLHEGVGILQEAKKRKVNINVIVIDNGGSWCTGGQPNSGDLGILKSMELDYFNSIDISKDKQSKLNKYLKDMIKTKGTKVLHIMLPLGSLSRD